MMILLTFWLIHFLCAYASKVQTSMECLDNECHKLTPHNLSSNKIDALLCTGKQSCQLSNISNVTFLDCSGDQSCQFTSIFNIPNVTCSGKDSCKRSNISFISQKLICQSHGACDETNMKHITQVQCTRNGDDNLMGYYKNCHGSNFLSVDTIDVTSWSPLVECTINSGDNSEVSIHVRNGDVKSIVRSKIYCVNNSTCIIWADGKWGVENELICDDTSKFYVRAPNLPRMVPFPMQENCFEWYYILIPTLPIVIIQVIVYYCMESKLYIVNQIIELLKLTNCSEKFYLSLKLTNKENLSVNKNHNNDDDNDHDIEMVPLIAIDMYSTDVSVENDNDTIDQFISAVPLKQNDTDKYFEYKQSVCRIINNICIATQNSSLSAIFTNDRDFTGLEYHTNAGEYIWKQFELQVHSAIASEINTCGSLYIIQVTQIILKFCYGINDEIAINDETKLNSVALSIASINYISRGNILFTATRQLEVLTRYISLYLIFTIIMHLLVLICLFVEFDQWKYKNITGYATLNDDEPNIYYKFPFTVPWWAAWEDMLTKTHPIFMYRSLMGLAPIWWRYTPIIPQKDVKIAQLQTFTCISLGLDRVRLNIACITRTSISVLVFSVLAFFSVGPWWYLVFMIWFPIPLIWVITTGLCHFICNHSRAGVTWPPDFGKIGSVFFKKQPNLLRLAVFFFTIVFQCLFFIVTIRLIHNGLQNVATSFMRSGIHDYTDMALFAFRDTTCLNDNVAQGFWPQEVNWRSIIVWASWWLL